MSVNRNHLIELSEILDEEFGSLIETYISDSRVRLDQALACLRSGEWELARREFHCLKGSSANIGAESFSAICQHLEWLLKNGECPKLSEYESNLEREFRSVVTALNDFVTGIDTT